MKTLEVCVDSVDSAIIAQQAGAQRVEFCDSLIEGGTTPSFGQLEWAKKQLTIKNYVIIRPRGGDFLYNDNEFEIMKSDIHCCGKLKMDGVVIGMLNADGTVDTKRCAELVAIAKSYNMGVTFHRAIDRTNDIFKAMEDIIALGCERILTSGGCKTAMEGVDVIKQLIQKANNRIIIMPGAGVTPENAAEILQKTGASEIHGTLKNTYPSNMKYLNSNMSSGSNDNGISRADGDKIKKVVTLLNSL